MPHFPTSGNTVASEALSKLSIGEGIAQMPTSEIPRPHRITVKNRRKRYLDLHPEYFLSAELELADPLLYDRLVRRYQSADEREKEGRQRGYTGVLEADLVRSEAKIDALKHPDPNSPLVYKRDGRGSIYSVDQDAEDQAMSKDDAWVRWIDVMSQRFMRGDDGDFDYAAVDGIEDFDDRDEEERSRLEQYFQTEEAQFVGHGNPTGETGIQDY